MASQKDELVFAALGGLGEIGMNLYLYGLGSGRDRQWLVVDFGVTFADATQPGIDLVFPDIGFLEDERKSVAGIVLTHAHEDHFGALIDLWPEIGVPVYATPFSAGLLRAKLAAERHAPSIEIVEVDLGSRFSVGPFDIELVTVTHSIPEPNALAITTPHGTVFHSGDWKLDPAPVLGNVTDIERIKEIGAQGCRALICDSTNIFREGESPSEEEVGTSLEKIIAEAKGRVAVTGFASNVARLISVIRAAKANGRHVVVVGRAMHRALMVAQEVGYFDDADALVSEKDYGYLPRDKVVLLMTGSQGEGRAALARVAFDDHPSVTLSHGDTVVFSSRTIPGNERAVGRIQNALVRQGIHLVLDQDALVHVSGHPRRGELRQLYDWLKPETVVPMHGEARHLEEHVRFARDLGVRQVIAAYNGDLLRLAPGKAEIVDRLPAGRLVKDGHFVISEGGEAQRERGRMSFNGAVFISVSMDRAGQVAGEPEARLVGIPDPDGEEGMMLDVVLDAVDGVLDSIPRPRRKDPQLVADALRRGVRAAVAQEWGKRPVCEVIVARI